MSTLSQDDDPHDEGGGVQSLDFDTRPAPPASRRPLLTWRRAAFVLAVVVVAMIVANIIVDTTVLEPRHGGTSSSEPPADARSVIFLIGDGMGAAVLTLARDALLASNSTHAEHLGLNDHSHGGGFAVPMEKAPRLHLQSHLTGMVVTRSLDTLVTDSAAAATALASGHATNNAWVSDVVDGEGYRAVGTMLEA